MVNIHHGSLAAGTVSKDSDWGVLSCFAVKQRHLPENSLIWPCLSEELAVAAVEEGEVGVNLQDPIGLDEEDAANVDEVASAA